MPGHREAIERRAAEAVADYITHHRPDLASELDCYRGVSTLAEAIRRAARARTASGGKHPHQQRIPPATLCAFGERLARDEQVLRAAQDFDELHRAVGEVGYPMPGIGELAVYDTALRIGAHLGLKPTRVYLHAGTRDGAVAVGIDARHEAVALRELPAAFARLDPHEVEDCLCVFKGLLAGDPSRAPGGCRCGSRGCGHRSAGDPLGRIRSSG